MGRVSCCLCFMFIAAVFASYLTGSSATGQVGIRLVSYENKESRLSDGSCCDMNLLCSMNKCDPYFRLCFVKASSGSRCSSWRDTKYFHEHTEISFRGDLGAGLTNPFFHQFNKWEGLDFFVEVWDDDFGTDDLVASYARLPIRYEAAWNSSAATAHQRNLSSTYTTLKLEVSVFCDKNYLVPDCTVQCVPQNDIMGHYTCDYKNGRRVCLPDWYGADCLTYCVDRNDFSGHYYCGNEGQLICLPGWRGDNCTLPIFRSSGVGSSSSLDALDLSAPVTSTPTSTFLTWSTISGSLEDTGYTTVTSPFATGSISAPSSVILYSSRSARILRSSADVSLHSIVREQKSHTNVSPSFVSDTVQSGNIYLTSATSAGTSSKGYFDTSDAIASSSSSTSIGDTFTTSMPAISSFSVASSTWSTAVDSEYRTRSAIKALLSSTSYEPKASLSNWHKIPFCVPSRASLRSTSSLNMESEETQEQTKASTLEHVYSSSGLTQARVPSSTLQIPDHSRATSTFPVQNLPVTRSQFVTAAGSSLKEKEVYVSPTSSTVGCSKPTVTSSSLITGDEVVQSAKLLKTSTSSVNRTETSSIMDLAIVTSSQLSTRKEVISKNLLHPSTSPINTVQPCADLVSVMMSPSKAAVEWASLSPLMEPSSVVVPHSIVSHALERSPTPTSFTSTPISPQEAIVIELQPRENGPLDPDKVKGELQLILKKKLNELCKRNPKACNVPEDDALLNKPDIFNTDDVIVHVERASGGLSITVKTSLPGGREDFVPDETLLVVLYEEKTAIEERTHAKVTRIQNRYYHTTARSKSVESFNLTACISSLSVLLLILLLSTYGVRRLLRRREAKLKVSPHSEVHSLESLSLSSGSTDAAFPLLDTASLLKPDKADLRGKQWNLEMSTIYEEFECTTPGQVLPSD